MVVSLSGAHAYGFPSPDSDVDLKAIHVAPTASLVGLRAEPASASRMEWVDGVEIDYSSNELGAALAGIVKGNGNYIERVIGHAPVATSPWLNNLRPLVAGAINRRVHRHYRGFATSQREAYEATPTTKKLLYVLRTTLTGTHLLRTGALVVDVTGLLDEYGFGSARELIAAKRAGERSELPVALRDEWRTRIDAAFALLDDALERTSLPTETPNVGEIDAWLIRVRREQF